MWQHTMKQLAAANGARGNVFWPDVHREAEQTMLRQLFATAIARNVLNGDHIERFLLEVCAMLASQGATSQQSFFFDLDAATRNLLIIDEKLAPLSLSLFGKRLLSDLDRETLKHALGASCQGSA